jgi:DNA recombination protein RmuC
VAHRAAGSAVDAINLSSTHLQRFLSARRRELDALEGFRAAVGPLSDAAASPTPIAAVRRVEEITANTGTNGQELPLD